MIVPSVQLSFFYVLICDSCTIMIMLIFSSPFFSFPLVSTEYLLFTRSALFNYTYLKRHKSETLANKYMSYELQHYWQGLEIWLLWSREAERENFLVRSQRKYTEGVISRRTETATVSLLFNHYICHCHIFTFLCVYPCNICAVTHVKRYLYQFACAQPQWVHILSCS